MIAAVASVALYGGAFTVLIAPTLRSLPLALAVVVAGSIVVFGGTMALLFTFPVVSTVLFAAAAVTTMTLMRGAERRTTSVSPA